jgi:hypothetical protein
MGETKNEKKKKKKKEHKLRLGIEKNGVVAVRRRLML